MNVYETGSLAEKLRSNTYPGRGIVLGLTADGTHSVAAYFIMGRSQNSRNRVFVEEPDGIRTQAFDPAKLEDLQLGRVKRLGADAVGLLYEHPVAAVLAAAHDEIGGYRMSAIGRQPQHDAPAGISIAPQLFCQGAGFIYIHDPAFSFFCCVSGSTHHFSGLGQQHPLSLFHHPVLQRLRRVAGQHLYRLLQQDGAAVCDLVDQMHRGSRHLDPTGQRRFVDLQPVISLAAKTGDQRRMYV